MSKKKGCQCDSTRIYADITASDCKTHSMSYSNLSLRDWFAGQALAGIEANEEWFKEAHEATHGTEDGNSEDFFASAAYEMADAMLRAR